MYTTFSRIQPACISEWLNQFTFPRIITNILLTSWSTFCITYPINCCYKLSYCFCLCLYNYCFQRPFQTLDILAPFFFLICLFKFFVHFSIWFPSSLVFYLQELFVYTRWFKFVSYRHYKHFLSLCSLFNFVSLSFEE